MMGEAWRSIPTAHKVLTADDGYVGSHRRYNACLGCFDELEVLWRAAEAKAEAAEQKAAALAAALEAMPCTGTTPSGLYCASVVRGNEARCQRCAALARWEEER